MFFFVCLFVFVLLTFRHSKKGGGGNLVSRVSYLTAPWSERGPGGGKMRDPGNEVVEEESKL